MTDTSRSFVDKATSSNMDEWRTPDDLFRVLAREFWFVLDLAAEAHNRKVLAFYGPDAPAIADRDALAVRATWAERARQVAALLRPSPADALKPPAAFVNPPFSRLDEFCEKAAAEAAKGLTIVSVLPNRSEKIAWHDHVLGAASEIRELKGRVVYVLPSGEPGDSAPFPTAVVIYRAGEPPMLGGPRRLGWDWAAEFKDARARLRALTRARK